MLFQLGDFQLASGKQSKLKIECDGLDEDDWKALAWIASKLLPPFREAIGVPNGGIPLALALNAFRNFNPDHPIVVCEDVLTTGGSMERFRKSLGEDVNAIGCVFIARGPVPSWVTPLFTVAQFEE